MGSLGSSWWIWAETMGHEFPLLFSHYSCAPPQSPGGGGWLAHLNLGHCLQGPRKHIHCRVRWASPLGSRALAGTRVLHFCSPYSSTSSKHSSISIWVIKYLKNKSDFEFSVYLSRLLLVFILVILHVILVLECFYGLKKIYPALLVGFCDRFGLSNHVWKQEFQQGS